MRKILAWLLVCLIVVFSCPAAVFAEGETATCSKAGTVHNTGLASILRSIRQVQMISAYLDNESQCNIFHVAFEKAIIVPHHTYEEEPGTVASDCKAETGDENSSDVCETCGEVDSLGEASTFEFEREYGIDIDASAYDEIKDLQDTAAVDEDDSLSEKAQEPLGAVEAKYSIKIENANGKTGMSDVYTVGSTVKVTVTLEPEAQITLSGAQVVLEFDNLNLKFDKAGKAEDSIFTNVYPMNPTAGHVVISALTEHAADATVSKAQKVAILYFVVTGGIEKDDVNFANIDTDPQIKIIANDNKYETYAINAKGDTEEDTLGFKCSFDTAASEIKISNWFDVDDNGVTELKDCQSVIQTIFNNAYDAKFDIDKDGTLSMIDVEYMYQYINGDLTAWDIFEMGLSRDFLAKF